jgi:FemAB-related protein (PEP-CTERM system-associated)
MRTIASVQPAAASVVASPSEVRASSLQVRSDLPDLEWDAFVSSHAQASAYHYAAWPRLIGRVFGHDVRMLSVETGGRTAAILPLVFMRSRLFGRFVVSLPFLNAGGIVSNDAAATRALVQAAIAAARDAGAAYLELRHAARLCPELAERRHKVGMALTLELSADAQWNALDRKIRNQVRKAEKSGLTVATGGAELVRDFYDVFSRNMRDLGTPVFPVGLFDEAARTFPDHTRLFCVYSGSQPVASALLHRRGAWAEVIWASALREFNPMCPNVFLYWHVIQSAIASGVRTFEFGRCTPGEGPFQFKQQWKAEAYPLVWEYWTKSGTLDFDASPRNPRYARAIALWRRLPLAATTAIGPRVVRGIPC